MRFLSRAALVAAAFTVCQPALADDDLERMERLTLAMNAQMLRVVTDMMPEAKDLVPTLTWNKAMADAATCSLAAYRKKIGDDGVETLLTNMEALVAREDLTLQQITEEGQKLSPLPDDEQLAIERECGMGKATSAAMMADPNFPKFMSYMVKALEQSEQ